MAEIFPDHLFFKARARSNCSFLFSSLFFFFLLFSVSDSAPRRWNENVYRGTCASDLSSRPSRYPAVPPPPLPLRPSLSSPPDNPCHREAAGESVRVTRRESKREEKRTGSGSIRRASERDGMIEGDRGNGEAAALLRLGGKGMGNGRSGGEELGYAGARERRGNRQREKDEERQSHRAFPGPSIGNLTNVRMETYENIEISILLTGRNEKSRKKYAIYWKEIAETKQRGIEIEWKIPIPRSCWYGPKTARTGPAWFYAECTFVSRTKIRWTCSFKNTKYSIQDMASRDQYYLITFNGPLVKIKIGVRGKSSVRGNNRSVNEAPSRSFQKLKSEKRLFYSLLTFNLHSDFYFHQGRHALRKSE